MNSGKQITYVFKTLEDVQKAYMPFVNHGGMFIRTSDEYALGEIVQLFLKFPEEEQPLELQGKVVWLTPDPSKITWISTSTTSGDRIFAGVGFQISGPSEDKFQEKIQSIMNGVDAHFQSDTI